MAGLTVFCSARRRYQKKPPGLSSRRVRILFPQLDGACSLRGSEHPSLEGQLWPPGNFFLPRTQHGPLTSLFAVPFFEGMPAPSSSLVACLFFESPSPRKALDNCFHERRALTVLDASVRFLLPQAVPGLVCSFLLSKGHFRPLP